MVSVEFRLGLLGFADLSPCGPEHAGSASNGFRDQMLALRWVRANIGVFGGDARNVTVFGQSGGGVSILALLGSPDVAGLSTGRSSSAQARRSRPLPRWCRSSAARWTSSPSSCRMRCERSPPSG